MALGLIGLVFGYKQITAIFARNATAIATPKENGPTSGPYLIVLYGAGTKSRTRDLLITNQLLYQLSYAGGICPRTARGGRIIGFSGLSDKGSC